MRSPDINRVLKCIRLIEQCLLTCDTIKWESTSLMEDSFLSSSKKSLSEARDHFRDILTIQDDEKSK